MRLRDIAHNGTRRCERPPRRFAPPLLCKEGIMNPEAIPLLAKEGWTRHQSNGAKPRLWSGRGGRSHETFQSRGIRALFLSLIFIQNPDSILNQIGIDQKLGAQIDPSIQFIDESGKAVTLGNYFGTKPILLTPVYYECPMLCSMLLNGLVQAMHVMPLTAGKDFDFLSRMMTLWWAPMISASPNRRSGASPNLRGTS